MSYGEGGMKLGVCAGCAGSLWQSAATGQPERCDNCGPAPKESFGERMARQRARKKVQT